VSVGERVSMSLLAMAVQQLGVQAKSFTGSQSGIITDTNHVSAAIVEVRPHRIQRALEEGYVAIVAGFQGMSLQKEVTTLGRGGSDTTAVALTAALQAEYCEICSDVAGVYSTDPRVVSNARLLDELSLDAAISMAKNGAKVLQAEALEFAQKSGITLVANATRNPAGKGTRLTSTSMASNPVAISFDRSVIQLFDPSEQTIIQIAPHIRFATTTGDREMYIVNVRNIHEQHGGRAVATVSVIGTGNVRSILNLLSSTQVELWWSDAVSTTLLVEVEEVDEVVAILHEELL